MSPTEKQINYTKNHYKVRDVFTVACLVLHHIHNSHPLVPIINQSLDQCQMYLCLGDVLDNQSTPIGEGLPCPDKMLFNMPIQNKVPKSVNNGDTQYEALEACPKYNKEDDT